MLKQQLEDERKLRLQQLDENERLMMELQRATGSTTPCLPARAPPTSSSEGRLRAALAGGAGAVELAQAIECVEALLVEARRELANKQLRERRAAFERLHQAEADAQEGPLAEALEAARRAGVDQEDIEKGEAKLRELHSMTAEQREAKAAKEQESQQKKQAYLLVKKDDADALLAFLGSLESKVRWQDWRDYQGRSLARCAQDLRSARASCALQKLLPEERARRPLGARRVERLAVGDENGPILQDEAGHSSASNARPGKFTWPGDQAGDGNVSQLVGLFQGGNDARVPSRSAQSAHSRSSSSGVTDTGFCRSQAKANGFQADGAAVAEAAISVGEPSPSPTSPAPSSPSNSLRSEEEEKLKRISFRAVVQDDTDAIAEVLDAIAPEVLSRWRNKAGKDLLTLSEERGSPGVYSVLAKAFGLLQEQKREPFEERQTVWVYWLGEVQPRRATVLEDTPAEADEVLVEYWDGVPGDAPAEKVDRSMVLRMWS